MAYQTYITEAIVCGAKDERTADRAYLLFTREGGMVYAHAKSVREERSKHRYALQVSSYVRVTLVRGKRGWRITGAEPLRHLYAEAQTREARTFLRNILLLLRRVIQGETAHELIFDDVVSACGEMDMVQNTSLESVLTLRILHGLGYIAPTQVTASFLHCPIPFDRVHKLTDAEIAACNESVLHGLTQSHM